MSQEKVDRYKQEKYNRKHNQKKNNTKKYLAYAGVTVVALALICWLGYSVAVSSGLYTPPTTPVTMSEPEIQSLRQKLIDSGDSNVKNVETTVAPDAQTMAVEETTKKAKDKKKSTDKKEDKEVDETTEEQE